MTLLDQRNSTGEITACCKRSRCMEIPTRVAAPATTKEQVGKCTELNSMLFPKTMMVMMMMMMVMNF